LGLPRVPEVEAAQRGDAWAPATPGLIVGGQRGVQVLELKLDVPEEIPPLGRHPGPRVIAEEALESLGGGREGPALSVSERLVRRLGDGSQSALGERLPVLEPTPRRGSGDQEPHESRRAPDRPPN